MSRKKTNTQDPNQKLNAQQIKFCELYAYGPNRGNGVLSYSEAYNIKLDGNSSGYGTCRSNASKLLTKTDILDYIRSLYESNDLNDTLVDNELAFVIKQNSDFGSKVAAIKEYNSLKSRIKNRLEVTTRTFKVEIEE
jgi:hypothetical protein